MKKIPIIVLALAILFAGVSCIKEQDHRSSAKFTQITSFNMTDYEVSENFIDGLAFSPYLCWDEVAYYKCKADAVNQGYHGGFILSVRTASEDLDDEKALFTAADPKGGVGEIQGYVVFNQTDAMPDYDIEYVLDNFYSASTAVAGCAICNTLYHKRLKEKGEIVKGDYLKVTAEFYDGSNLVGSLEKYLIDYRGDELKMFEEWGEWNMNNDATLGNISIGSFKAVKFKVTTSGPHIKPVFCIDNYGTVYDVVY